MSSSSRSVSPIRWRSTSTSNTFTLTTCPDFTTSCGSETNRLAIADTCTNPSWCTPTSTKAPNAATLVTTPSRTIPGLRSATFSTPAANVAVVNAGRGSRPGFSSSARMSEIVGIPNRSSAKSAGRIDRRVRSLPMSSAKVTPDRSRMLRTTG